MLGTRPAFSAFSASDVEAERAFYADTIGVDVNEDDGARILGLAGGQRVFVYPKSNHTPATFTVLNFEVDDIEAAVDELVARGVTFERYEGFGQDERGIIREPRPPIAWFKDPLGQHPVGYRGERRGRRDRLTDRRATGGAAAVLWMTMGTMTTSMVTFDTELGRCAVRWSDAGITRGAASPIRAASLARRTKAASPFPASCGDAIDGVQGVMAGTAVDLGDVPLDEGGLDDFRRAVYAATREIAAGTTRSYGEIARAIGPPDAAPGTWGSP